MDIHTLIQIQDLISDMNESEIKELISSLIEEEDKRITEYMEEN